ncbi:MAG: TIGR03560 family F420-dependent LLM class oxidoreductase [Thermodesulfobacteriota bacterium]
MSKVEFGVMLRQQKIDFSDILQTAKLCDELGYHSVWFYDHVLGQGLIDIDIYEPWTVMSALSTATTNIRLGTMVLCNGFRHPPLLAKMASTLDVISNGRVEFAIGAGWFKEEFDAYGYEFPDTKTRIEMLGESVSILRSMWTEKKSSFNGKHYQINDAICNPKPIQKPHIPISIGGSGEKYLLKLVGELADEWNSPASSAIDFDRKYSVLKNHCSNAGRDINDINISQQTVCVLVEKRSDLEEKMVKAQRRYGFFGDIQKFGIIGTPDDCIKKIYTDIEKGISKYTIFFSDVMSPDTIKFFAKEVMSEFN